MPDKYHLNAHGVLAVNIQVESIFSLFHISYFINIYKFKSKALIFITILLIQSNPLGLRAIATSMLFVSGFFGMLLPKFSLTSLATCHILVPVVYTIKQEMSNFL